jgi:hypothetical protein
MPARLPAEVEGIVELLALGSPPTMATAPPRMDAPGQVALLLESELLELAIAALTSAEDGARPEPPLRRRRAVERALEYLDGHRQPPPTIFELCRVAGMSQRTLEYRFRDGSV